MPSYTCRICGKPGDGEHFDNGEYLIADKLCFSCGFWQRYIDQQDDPNIARVNGTHYYIAAETSNPYGSRGFGGALFVIQFHDGRVVRTTNLWCQGDIPKEFQKLLPDNAKFLE
jgi:hypothetical protein